MNKSEEKSSKCLKFQQKMFASDFYLNKKIYERGGKQ